MRSNTEDALAAGAFGVPSMFARGQMFWGYDDMDALERVLDGRDPLGEAPDFSAWDRVKSTVTRRR